MRWGSRDCVGRRWRSWRIELALSSAVLDLMDVRPQHYGRSLWDSDVFGGCNSTTLTSTPTLYLGSTAKSALLSYLLFGYSTLRTPLLFGQAHLGSSTLQPGVPSSISLGYLSPCTHTYLPTFNFAGRHTFDSWCVLVTSSWGYGVIESWEAN